eukprot:TRINITY_DN26027_c0_g1_i1.p1 TRINITY_DN26027_c0_g1~~TRINITY_DN26027_c0_g1_i1.p1  ORF type:complete len:221 (+),score=75.95 TRINITY_DN26027_c0_g1_i1:74-736(+)
MHSVARIARAAATASRPLAMRRTAAPRQARFCSTGEQFKKWKQQVQQSAAEQRAASEWVKENGSPYKMLGLEENASTEDVKSAYKRLSLVKHPDKGGSLDEFQKIQYAQQIILNGTYSQGGAAGGTGGTPVMLTKSQAFFIFLVAGCVAYIVVFMPLRWAARKIGLVAPPSAGAEEPVEVKSLRDEVRSLQASVDKLQETLEEVQREIERSKYPRRKTIL